MSTYDSNATDAAELSPEGPPSTKRRRIALACLDCRRRKLKCDRTFPACTRCQKGGNAASCIYDPDAVESIAGTTSAEGARADGQSINGHQNADHGGMTKSDTSPTSFVHHHALDTDDSALAGLKAHIYRLENRVIGLEKLTHDPQHRYGFPVPTNSLRPSKQNVKDGAPSEEKDLMMFRGKSFKTQFFGASHNASYLSYLPELRTFMKEAVIQHPTLAHIQRELKGVKIKSEPPPTSTKSGDNLIQLLPGREETDRLVNVYIDCFESTYRVLHLPSFLEEYRQIWSTTDQVKPAFIALILVMMAATSCLKPQDPSFLRGDSTLDREAAIKWIHASSSWLEQQSHKHVTLLTFQIHCVTFIAQEVNGIKRKRTWTSAGTLSRLAMGAGLHRDAEIVNLRHGTLVDRRVSLFDQEMRKRIWCTIAELELQTSIERGMPAMLKDVIVDCGPPWNVDDEEINRNMDRNRISRPVSEFTRSSYLYLSQSTSILRQELISLINGPSSQISYEEVLQYDRQIVQALDEVPAWRSKSTLLPRSLLQMQLQLLLLLLHRPYVHRDTESSRYDYSAMTHLRAAMSLLDLHHNLYTAGTQILCVLREDMLDAVLGICYNFSISDPLADNRMSSWNRMVGFTDPGQYLENGHSLVENKINRLGVGIQDYYCACAVIGLHKKMFAAEKNPTPTYEYQAAERVARKLQVMLSHQDSLTAAATLASLPNMPITSPNGVNGGNTSIGVMTTTIGSATPMEGANDLEDFGRDLGDFDLTNVSGWDLEAFFNF